MVRTHCLSLSKKSQIATAFPLQQLPILKGAPHLPQVIKNFENMRGQFSGSLHGGTEDDRACALSDRSEVPRDSVPYLSLKKHGNDMLIHKSLFLRSAPVRIRTSNLLIRSQMLYPVELRVLRLKRATS